MTLLDDAAVPAMAPSPIPSTPTNPPRTKARRIVDEPPLTAADVKATAEVAQLDQNRADLLDPSGFNSELKEVASKLPEATPSAENVGLTNNSDDQPNLAEIKAAVLADLKAAREAAARYLGCEAEHTKQRHETAQARAAASKRCKHERDRLWNLREAEQTKCDERLISLSNALINSTAEINARSDAAQYLLVAKVTAVGKAIRSNLTAAAAINEQVKLAGLKSHGNTADQDITNVVKLALGKDASKDAVTRVARVVASFLDEGIEPDQVQQRLMQNNAEGHHGIRVIYDALRAAEKAKTEKAGHGPNGGLAQDPKQEPPNPAPRPKITTGILDTVLGGRAPLVHVDGEDHAEGGDGEHPPSKQQDIVQVNTGMRTIGGTAPELTPSIAKLNERITELEAELAAWKLEEAKPEKRRRGRRVRSRAEGWRQAVSQGLEAVEVIEEAMEELNSYKEEYQNWLDNMPENLQGSAKAEMLETITSMDFEADLSEITSMFEEADGAELPGMMG